MEDSPLPPSTKALYFSGENRALDVAKLHEGLTLTPGALIPHEAIEEILHLPRQSHIYRYVTTKWRKEVFRNQQIKIIAVRAKGFQVLPNNQAIQALERSFLGAQKRTVHIVEDHNVMPTYDLSQLETAMYYHHNRFMQAMAAEIRKVAKEIAHPKPQEQRPKRPIE